MRTSQYDYTQAAQTVPRNVEAKAASASFFSRNCEQPV